MDGFLLVGRNARPDELSLSRRHASWSAFRFAGFSCESEFVGAFFGYEVIALW
jgi:hypothetical protein